MFTRKDKDTIQELSKTFSLCEDSERRRCAFGHNDEHGSLIEISIS